MHRHQQRRDDQLRDSARRRRSRTRRLATARSASVAHQPEPARDDLAIVELGDGRKARALGDDQAQQQLALGAEHLLLEHGEEGVERRGGRHGRARSATLPSVLDDGRDGAADQRLEQRFLVLEVEVERALGDAGAGRHVVEPGRLEAVLGEHARRRLEDRLAARIGIDLGRARAFGGLCWLASGTSSTGRCRLARGELLLDARPPAGASRSRRLAPPCAFSNRSSHDWPHVHMTDPSVICATRA